jgi:hypothetical protein
MKYSIRYIYPPLADAIRDTSYKLRKLPIQPNLPTIYESFMQNEPNFPDTQMNVNPVITREYRNISNWTLGENEPKTNPIKPNFKGAPTR